MSSVCSGKMTALFVLALLMASCVTNLFADSMRCGSKVVRDGDSPALLLDACGEPGYKGRGYAEIDTGSGMRKVRVEQWHYKLGERKFERIVLIYQGEIVAIETGGR